MCVWREARLLSPEVQNFITCIPEDGSNFQAASGSAQGVGFPIGIGLRGEPLKEGSEMHPGDVPRRKLLQHAITYYR